MLKIKTTNDKLLGPLQQVTGIVERRHTLPILSNVLITASGSVVEFLATDLEVQITSRAELASSAEGAVTAGARKLQDIRYYLNGVLFSVDKETLRVVATDGHRLSYASRELGSDHGSVEAILPRKTVLELIKLLGDTDEPVSLAIGSNQARFSFGGIEIVSKIVEGKFPDYQKVIPAAHKNRVTLERPVLAQSLNRAAILSNEKIRGVRLVFTKDALSIICTNNEQEEAEEGLVVEYDGDPLDIGFNISYLLDVLNHVGVETVTFTMGDSTASALVQLPGNDDFKYVVMPMRI